MYHALLSSPAQLPDWASDRIVRAVMLYRRNRRDQQIPTCDLMASSGELTRSPTLSHQYRSTNSNALVAPLTRCIMGSTHAPLRQGGGERARAFFPISTYTATFGLSRTYRNFTTYVPKGKGVDYPHLIPTSIIVVNFSAKVP